MRKPKWIVAAVIAVAVVATVLIRANSHPYTLIVVMPAADGTIAGTPVLIGGEPVGKVTDIGVAGDAAKLTLQLDGQREPLHAGTTARISWNSVLGHREVEILPGPASNPVLPSGQIVTIKVERVELDDLVDALDAPTRAKVHALVASLDTTLRGDQGDLNATLKAAGPFVQALGKVLQGIGADQPAIDQLVTRLNGMTTVIADRSSHTSDTVLRLTRVINQVAAHEKQLSRALNEVPATLTAATNLLNHVPGAVNEASPLLEQLRPATDQLPAVAKKLNPVLTELKPTVHDLKPTLAAAQSLLGQTPALLDMGTATVPSVQSALAELQPAVSFLRPYTPEVVGFLTNWASLFSAKNAAGHFGRAMIPASASALNDSPSTVPVGMTQWQAPLPGQLAGQSWTDANGDTVR